MRFFVVPFSVKRETDLKEHKEILELLASAHQAGKRTVLATIVDVQGSAYRQAGAHLLLVEDGRKAGSISSGCLENDLIARGSEVFDSKQATLLEYETDELIGLNNGCDGTIKILVQPLAHSKMAFPYAFQKAEELSQTLGIATVFECSDQSAIGTQILFSASDILCTSASAAITKFVAENCINWISKRSRCERYCFEDARVFVELVKPSTRLAIFGAGEDVVPLVAIARNVGFEPHIIDSRRSYLERFSESEKIHHFDSNFCLSERFDAIVIMSHSFELDKRFLVRALESNCEYIGVMGSRRRTEKLLAEIAIDNAAERIKFPIGLDLGADAPEEIALSICSELLAFFRNASGQPLSKTKGSIHQRAEELRLTSCATGNQNE